MQFDQGRLAGRQRTGPLEAVRVWVPHAIQHVPGVELARYLRTSDHPFDGLYFRVRRRDDRYGRIGGATHGDALERSDRDEP